MNVVVLISDHNGHAREAIPVRAIPLLTNWSFFSPDVVAQVFAGDEEQRGFISGELQAFHLENDQVNPLKREWWVCWAARELPALSKKIKDTGLASEVGYQQWREESLPLLPAGVFVWKEDFEQFHALNWDGRFRILSSSIPTGDGGDDVNPPIGRAHAAFIDDGLTALERWRELDFAPYIRPALSAVVLEGVPIQQAATVMDATPPESNSAHYAEIERKGMMAAMRERMKSIEYLDDEGELEQENEDAETDVSAHQQELDEIAERGRVTRVGHAELFLLPQTMTPSTAPLALDCASGGGVKVWTPDSEREFQASVEGLWSAALAPQPPPRAEPTPASAASEAQYAPVVANRTFGGAELDYSLLATREELIAAFGAFTGMNMSWFKNITDKPELLAARAVAGTPGRNGAPPLFHPFPAMQWLVDPNRKVGRGINPETAWRMLKQHFPRVHSVYLDFDPNSDIAG